MRRTTLFVMAALVVVGSGCKLRGLRGRSDGGVSITSSNRLLVSKDGRFSLTVPAGWTQAHSLNESAGIQARGLDGYAVVLSDVKEDLSDSSLEGFSRGRAQAIITNSNGGKMGPSSEVMIGGRRALQREINATVKGMNITYLLTVVETTKHLHQVLCWAAKSRFEGNRAEFEAISATLKEN